MLSRFQDGDVFRNRIRAHPKIDLFFYAGNSYYQNEPQISGVYTSSVPCRSPGEISLFELNVDRPSTQLIYPFITKQGSLTTFKTVSTRAFNEDFSYGDTITGTYPLVASVSRLYYAASTSRPTITSLRNTLDFYRIWSPAFAYSSDLGDKSTQELSLISIPSIFYGSSIKKGTVSCKFYVTGTLIGELQDERRNGELVQVGPYGSNGSGSVAGVVLYNEGFMVLTGSWDISNGTHTEAYITGAASVPPAWVYFAAGVGAEIDSVLWGEGLWGEAELSTDYSTPSSSYGMTFNGTQYTSVITMLAHARKGELNFSNNPTFIEYGNDVLRTAVTGAKSYRENGRAPIKNTVQSNYADPTGSFIKQTFVSKVGIYDEHRNLIAIAKLAKPVRKREIDDYTFKLKLDI